MEPMSDPALECERTHRGHYPVSTVLVGGTACCAVDPDLLAAMVRGVLDSLLPPLAP